MTMLDTMRRHRGWLKWLLGLIVLAFIFFYVPDFIRGSDGANVANAAVAEVEGTPITAREYQRQLNARMQMFRASGGGNVSEQMLKQLGIDRQVLQSLIEQRATEAEARRLGLKVTDVEVREFILHLPGLQENGQFVGYERYRAALRGSRPPMTETEFEEAVRRDLLSDKLQTAVTAWVTVPDSEVDDEYRRRNEKVKLEVVGFQADAYRTGLTASDAEAAAAFEKNKEKYRIGERRKIRYLVVDTQALRAKVIPSAQDVDRAYNGNIEQYSNPEQVHATHILFKTEGKDEATVRKQAESVLAEVKAGGDFAALATKYSEDDVSKVKGGDLDFFGRGAMVKPFEDVAFALAPGQTSDLVKSDFGFHIIRVLEKRAAGVKPLAEVRDQIVDQLKWERAQEQASTLATELAGEISKPADLDTAAKKRGLAVKESTFFQRTDPIGELGPSPQVATSAFSLKDGQVSEAIRVPQGFAFITVSGKEASRLPKLDEVRERVRLDVIADKAKALAQAKAAELTAALKGGAAIAAAAKAAGREVRTTELIARGSVIPDIGVSPAVDKVAFALPAGGSSDPIPTDSGAAVVHVVEKTPVTPADMAAARDALRRELISTRRNRFFSSYMAKAKEKLDIRTYPQVLARAGG
jgi:peptidyl-prolyl cis-trans isomerase D